MDSGAALRARAISAFRSGIRYSLSAAMLEYGVLDCACICELAPSVTTTRELASPSILNVLRPIDFPFRRGFWDRPTVVMRLFPSVLHRSYRRVCLLSGQVSTLGRGCKDSLLAKTVSCRNARPAIFDLPLASGLVPGAATRSGHSPFFDLIPSSEDPANSSLKRRTPPTPQAGT